jgi:hypothetical protein
VVNAGGKCGIQVILFWLESEGEEEGLSDASSCTDTVAGWCGTATATASTL